VEIAESLRSAPLGVREVRSRWLRWLAVAGVVAAIGSGVYTLVSALTAPSVATQVAPISRTAERVDRGLTGLEAALDRARARYRAARERLAPDPSGQAADPGRREYSIGGGAFRITVDRGVDPEAESGGLLGGWRARISAR
jgi:hypothetical protein